MKFTYHILDLCNHNALVANSLNRLDLMQTWQLASLVASSLEQSKNDIMMSPNPFHSDDTNNLSLHPFGWNMVQDLYVLNLLKFTLNIIIILLQD